MFTPMADDGFKSIPVERARELLAKYTDPNLEFAWPLYDNDPNPSILSGVDLTSPALLSYPIKSKILNQFGQSPSVQEAPHRYGELLQQMRKFVGCGTQGDFRNIPASVVACLATREYGSDVGGPEDFNLLIGCLDAARDCKGVTSVAITKILHRKRPDLVPINDSRLRSFYGVKSGYPKLFEAIHRDLNDPETYEILRDLALPYVGDDGRPMSVLRVLDIVIWMESEQT